MPHPMLDAMVSDPARDWSADCRWWVATFRDFRQLQATLRGGPCAWMSLMPGQLASFGPWPLAFATMHADGFVRHRAMLRLEPWRPEFLPFLLLRLVDGVPVIRETARLALPIAFDPAWNSAWLPHLALVLQLAGGQRNQWVAPTMRYLAFQDELVPAALALPQPELRRRMARFLLDYGKGAEWMFQHADGQLRYLAGQAMLQRDPEQSDVLLQDREPRLRKLALAGLAHDAERVRRAMFDRSRRVRDLAAFYYRKLGHDAKAAYREALQPGHPHLAAALFGLAEQRAREVPLEELQLFLHDPQGRVREAALEASVALHGDDFEAAPYLRDPSNRVARAAWRACRPVLGLTALEGLLDHPGLRDHALRELCRRSPVLGRIHLLGRFTSTTSGGADAESWLTFWDQRYRHFLPAAGLLGERLRQAEEAFRARRPE